MVFFNHATRQMTVKIVYYGPGLCGKTTNLSAIYDRTAQKARGEMVSLNTETDRTLFFDLLPMEVGVISGFKAKLQLYTVPGQVFYNSTRKLVLKGVDGIVFVADSQEAMLDANRESLENLRDNLRELGQDLSEIPTVFQWNKRDLKQIVSVEALERELNPLVLPSFQAIARTGEGVFETLRGISRLALAHIKRLYLAEAPVPPGEGPVPANGKPAWAPPAETLAAVPPWSAPTPPPDPSPPAPAGPSWPVDGAQHPAAGPRSGESLAEALSYLDLSAALDLFEQVATEDADPDPDRTGEGPLKVMQPLVVKMDAAQPAQGPTSGPPGPNGLPVVPALALQAGEADTRPGPVLQVPLPPEADGDLELQVLVRHRGVVVAQAAAVVPRSAGRATGGLFIEWKRV
jgi:signal recognition particle receptor subunit beta